MAVSVFELFKIGIGPSSSHTVGPMRAAATFVNGLQQHALLAATHSVRVELYGSLGATGKGHGSDKAILLGLLGEAPDLVDIETIENKLAQIRATGRINLLGVHDIAFNEKEQMLFYPQRTLPYHSNGMRFIACDADKTEISSKVYYSVGGGFVVNEDAARQDRLIADNTALPYPFHSGTELLAMCEANRLSVSQLMMENEKTWRTEPEIRSGLLTIWRAMQDCVKRGCAKEGTLPGPMQVRRRAASLHRKLALENSGREDPLTVLDWVNLYALAVNEENATGGRVVTAPTNGAAGIIPAVLHYYHRFVPGADDDGVVNFLLTAAAIGILYKENASISGAEVGCQGEVGVACSMAAGGLAEVMGGTPAQVENAAEIGMEHNLGLTCDPVGGLVQVPCIERNAMGSVKAINAVRIALRGDGRHFVSLDNVIKTMRDTGADMKTKYKETSRGGLAVNVIEC